MIVAFNSKIAKVKTQNSRFTVVKMADSSVKFNVSVHCILCIGYL